ncbi:hypothetical protein MBRA1_002556 [Malassezia brasiliensis]|uniref:CCDC174 alpha/beta GRSR domain-containing protein n=1 Tax=Malassezia brasiliensis TaxID=1821822 RepID=A0AAF0DUC5_9BASI|nr:hypothetical protein MBRA1_002556 [Malassezia brasiliensis]
MQRSGVNASSVMGLKAELHAARQRAEQKREAPNKRARTEKLRFAEASHVDTPKETFSDDRLVVSRIKLQRKARTYAQIQEGRTSNRPAEGLVDWDLKAGEDADYTASDASDVDRPASPPPDDPDDPLVEHVDEFGRTRMVRRSELPRAPTPEDDEPGAIYGPATSFPVYQRAPHQLEVRPPRPLSPEPEHFDADWEIRTRGAAFYKFDANEDVRRAQQRDLQALRDETQARRAERGAAPITERRTTLGAARRASRQRVIDAHRTSVR